MENLFYQPELINGFFYLSEDESRHCIKVLRKKRGDPITLTDGKGKFYKALITEAKSSKCQFVVESVTETPEKNYTIHLGISPTKNPDRIEWMVEKCVEIGIDRITLVLCKHTERKFLKADRIEKVAVSAMKQSHRAFLPAIHPLIPFYDFIHSIHNDYLRYIAYVDHTNPTHLVKVARPSKNYVVLIGPEGDFSNEELTIALHHDFTKVSLGDHRLRTETAGLAACHILNLINAT